MAERLDNPAGAFVSAIATMWARAFLFVAACCSGTAMASLIRSHGDLSELPGLMPLVLAPVLWLISPVYLVADLLTVVLLIVLLRTDSGRVAMVCVAANFMVWFVHGLLMGF